MENRFDVLVIGGGLNGSALALSLAQGGFKVCLVEADERPQDADGFGRSYAIALASSKLLRAIGIWPDLEATSQPINEIKVTDGRAGEGPSPFWMHFDHAELEEGPMGYMIEDASLRSAFWSKIGASSKITHITGKSVVAQSLGTGVEVELNDGTVLSASVLVGADGKSSGVADRAGITRSFKDYGQTALVAVIAHEQPHDGIAHQFFMPNGPLAILPLKGNRSSIVWAESTDLANRLTTLSDAEFIKELRPAFGDFLGAISVKGQRFAYPLSQSLAADLAGPRLALVGDAAHSVHPIAGQGLNQGFRDIAALAEVLILAKRRGEDPGASDVLERYVQWRRFDRHALSLATDKFNGIFSNNSNALRAVRDVGMGVVNSLPALRRGFIREAAGLTGDLPQLLKGQPF